MVCSQFNAVKEITIRRSKERRKHFGKSIIRSIKNPEGNFLRDFCIQIYYTLATPSVTFSPLIFHSLLSCRPCLRQPQLPVHRSLMLICSKDFCNLCVAVIVNADAVCYVEISFLTHGLYLGNDFTHEAFFHQFGCQVCVQNNGQVVVARGYEAVLSAASTRTSSISRTTSLPSTVKETLPSAFSCAMKPLPSTSFR